MLKVKEILDCILVAGEFDFFLKIRARDMADFNKLQGQTLIALPGVRQTRTFFVMKFSIEIFKQTFERFQIRRIKRDELSGTAARPSLRWNS